MCGKFFLVLAFLASCSGNPAPISTSTESTVSVSSTTVKVLVPPPSPPTGEGDDFDGDDDDAVIIEADSSALPVDSTPSDFNRSECLLPPVKGPCKAVIESWFWNKKTSKCDLFQWSGCGGNNNRFSEKEFCSQHCGQENGNETVIVPGSVSGNPDDPSQQTHLVQKANAKPGEPKDVCNLPETRGNCRAMMTRWRYNAEIKECTQFHYGGCDGNPNNFVSREKCTEFCKGQ